MGPFAPGSVPTEVFDLRGVLRAFETIGWILQAWIVSPHMGQSYSVNLTVFIDNIKMIFIF